MCRIINTLTSSSVTGFESIASEPVVAPAGLSLLTVRAISAFLTRNIDAWQDTGFEAVLCDLFLLVGWEMVRVEELVDDLLLVTNSINEHSAVVAVIVDTPLNFDLLAGLVRGYNLVAPVLAGLVVVDAVTGVVAAWSASANYCGLQVRPCIDRFEDRAFGT